jgi:hypothetical protein
VQPGNEGKNLTPHKGVVARGMVYLGMLFFGLMSFWFTKEQSGGR